MAQKTEKSGGVSYVDLDATSFENRILRRPAGRFTLWMLGVGAVIAGDYSGWNFGPR